MKNAGKPSFESSSIFSGNSELPAVTKIVLFELSSARARLDKAITNIKKYFHCLFCLSG